MSKPRTHAAEVDADADADAHDDLLHGELGGGKDAHHMDRALAAALVAADPVAARTVYPHRAFQVRAVNALAQDGVTQFLVLGAGYPTAKDVHDIAGLVNDAARVVYVDRDPMVQVYGAALRSAPAPALVSCVRADVCRPDDVMSEVATLLDWSRPVAILMVQVPDFLSDADVAAIISATTTTTTAAVGGGYLVVSGTTRIAGDAVTAWADAGIPVYPRDAKSLHALISSCGRLAPPLAPGWADAWRWRSATDRTPPSNTWCAVLPVTGRTA